MIVDSQGSEHQPQPFQLPDKYIVQEGLEKEIMSGNVRTKFLVSAMFCYKQQSTKAEYTHVAQQIVHNYPFMGQQENLVHMKL